MENFLNKSKTKHGDRFDYSKVLYVNATTKVIIICPEHGEFEQTPTAHYKSNGCKECNSIRQKEFNKIHNKKIASKLADKSMGDRFIKFVDNATSKYGSRFMYNKDSFSSSRNMMIITCPEHGEFEQTPSSHLRSEHGCPKCGADSIIGKDEFLKKARIKHGDKFDYSKIDYINNSTKITINCSVHGEFEQTPSSHLASKNGCPECYGKMQKPENKISSLEEFINKSSTVHNNFYDYSKVEYVNNYSKVVIICPEHGEFNQVISDHVKGRGCMKCGYNKLSKNNSDALEKFIVDSKKIHGDKYDYSKVEYKNSATDVIITCPEHGEFLQKPIQHKIGRGCRVCGHATMLSKNSMNKPEFVEKSINVHGNMFDYSHSNYSNTLNKVEIICNNGHKFMQRPNDHLDGHGCPRCANEQTSSKAELELLSFIRSIYSGSIIENTRSVISPYEIDIYIPDLKLAIEFNGLYYHSEQFKDRKYHSKKWKSCLNKDVRLVQMWEHEWIEKQELCKAFISSLLVQPIRLYARKLIVKTVSIDEQREFLNLYHFQGYTSASTVFGLYNSENELIQLMSFKKLNQTGDYEIGRLCTKSGYAVVGGSERLYKTLISETAPKSLISYNNLDKFTGEVYSKLGLQLEKDQIDSYFYQKSQFVYPRQQFQKHKLVEQGHNPNLTEVEIANSMGYYRVFPTGNSKYSKKF